MFTENLLLQNVERLLFIVQSDFLSKSHVFLGKSLPLRMPNLLSRSLLLAYNTAAKLTVIRRNILFVPQARSFSILCTRGCSKKSRGSESLSG